MSTLGLFFLCLGHWLQPHLMGMGGLYLADDDDDDDDEPTSLLQLHSKRSIEI
jgi:hypothetical protein